MQLLLEIVRSSQAADPFAFQLGPQQYVLRTALGGAETARLDWDDALIDDLLALRSAAPSGERVQRVGDRLRAFLSTTSFGLSEAALLDAVGRGEVVMVTLRFSAAELFSLPWELLTLGATGGQLGALPGVVLRYAWPQTQTAQPADPTPPSESGRILFAWSAAGGGVPAAEQVLAIAQACQRGQQRFDAEKDVLAHVSPQRLVQALKGDAGQRPVAVLHLLCHGAERDGAFGLAWNDEDGDECFIDAAQLRQIVTPHASTLRLVVLSACDGGNSGPLGSHLGSVAQALHRVGVQTVVASRYPLSVAASLRLTQQLYDSLLCDLSSVEMSFVAARQTLLHASSQLDWASLQLYARPEDGDDNRPILFRPYVGLSSFRYGQSRFLFGRDEERSLARQKLAGLSSRGLARFLVVSGASGTGKSSLVLGGLLPDVVAPSKHQPQSDTLRQTTAELARILAALPKQNQTLALRQALTQVAQELGKLSLGQSADGWEWAVLRLGPSPLRSLDEALAQRQDAKKPLLLVVDQLEELFTLCDDVAERVAFARKLWMLAQQPDGISVVVTLRVDFLGRCGELLLDDKGLTLDRIAYAEDHRVFVAKPTPEQLAQAICGPARLLGLELAPSLVQRMQSEVVGEPGALPLLSYVLDLLWLRRDGRTLSERVYAELGGVAGALSQSADRVYDSLGPDDKRLARQLLIRLVHVGAEVGGETRRRMPLDALAQTLADPGRRLDAVIGRFVEARLLVRDEESGTAVIEFAHESLIRRWQLLRGFLDEDRQRLVQLAELSQWVTQYRGYGTLLRGAQLGYAERLADKYPDELGPDAQRLVTSSLRAQRRRRWLITMLATLVGVSLTALSLRAHQSEQLAQAEKREAQSKTRTAEARLLGQHAEQAVGEGGLLYAARAFQLRQEPLTRSVLWGALVRSEKVARFLRLPGGRVHGLAFSPDSRGLVAAAGEAGLWRLDVGTGAVQPLRLPVSPSCPTCAMPEMYAVAWSPDGKSVAAAGQGGQIFRWTVAADGTLSSAAAFATPARALYSLVFGPDSARLAAGAGDGQVFVLDASSGAMRKEGIGRGTTQIVAALAFSPGAGNRLAVVGNSGQLSLYDAETGQLAARPLAPQRGYLSSVGFSSTGQLLAAASEDGQVLLWNSQTGEPQRLDGSGSETAAQSGVSFGPDGRWLLSCGLDGALRLWNVVERRAAKETLTAPGPVYSCLFAPDGRQVASGGDGLVVLWDVTTHPALHRSQLAFSVTALAATRSGQQILMGSHDGSLRMWPAQQLAPNPALLLHGRAINALSVSVDDRVVATGSSDGSVAVVALDGLGRRRTFSEPGHGGAMAVALSGDGDTVAAGYSDGTLAWYGIASGRRQALISSRQQSIGALQFSIDGRFLWSGGLDGTIRTTEIASGQTRCPQAELNPAHKDAVMSLSLDPTGRVLASGSRDQLVGLWRVDGQSGCLTATGAALQKHRAPVAALAFDASGRRLASGGEDAQVVLWDVEARRLLGLPITSHRRPISGLVFGSDGWLWSADSETVWRWDVDESRWLARACTRAGHNLSQAEWQRALGDSPYCRICAAYPAGENAPVEAPVCPAWLP